MLTPHRLYIASVDAGNIERAFSAAPDFSVLGSAKDGRQALTDLLHLLPDAVILDSVLIGLDGTEALRRLRRMAAPPRVLYLLRTGLRTGDVQPDAVCSYLESMEAGVLTEKAREAAGRPLPALAAPWQQTRLDIASRLLDQLGVNRRLRGWELIRLAAADLACAPQLAVSLSGRLYPFVADRCRTTPRAAEKAIRTAVEDTWLRGNLGEIQRLFGLTVDAEKGKPTNAEFLSMLAEHVRRETQKRIWSEGA